MQSKNYFKELKKLLPKSLSPITGVKVAAIIVSDKGIFKGVNYEDAVLNLGLCAERNAIFNGVTNGLRHIYEIHILSSVNRQNKTLHMCGACRQVANNFAKKDTKVFLYTLNGKRKEFAFGELYPHSNYAFSKAITNKKK